MKKKLHLIIIPMLFITSLLQAQLIKVWDLGAKQLDGAIYENMLSVATMNAEFGDGNPDGTETGADFIGKDFRDVLGENFHGGDLTGGVKYLTNSTGSDRLRTTNVAITRKDDNLGGDAADVGMAGRIYVNSSGKRDRYLSITTTVPNQEITLIIRADNVPNDPGFSTHTITDSEGFEKSFEISGDVPDKNPEKNVSSSNTKEIHITLPTAAEYQYYDEVGKPSFYRVYFGNVNVAGIDAANAIGRTLGVNDVVSAVSTDVRAVNSRVYVSNVKSKTEINIYSITGALVKSIKTTESIDFGLKQGLYIATVKTSEGQKSVKLLTR